MPESFANAFATDLNGAINNSVTAITVDAAAPTALQTGQSRFIIDSEIIILTAGGSGTSWTVTRGAEGTTAASHADEAAVTHILTAASLQALVTNPIGAVGTRGQGIYLASGFVDAATADTALYLHASNDGKKWSYLSQQPLYTPASGTLRDPSLMVIDPNAFYSPQPTTAYWLCHTNEGSPLGFDVISSPDLEAWTLVHHVDCTSIASLVHVWAPEWFIDSDGSVHVFVACSNSGTTAFQIYETHPTNAAMTTWSNPVLVTGTSLPTDIIDPFLVKAGSTYEIWCKDDSTKYIIVLTSTSLTSGYIVAHSGDWASWGSALEGPSLLQVDSSTWRIYFDKYTQLGIYYSESTDSRATWSAKALITSPFIPSHGTYLRPADFPTARNIWALAMAEQANSLYVESFITSDTSLGNHLTWTTVTSVVLAPGEWDLTIMCTFRNEAATATAFMMRIWDSTTTFLSDETYTLPQFSAVSASKSRHITLNATTTLTLQASNFAGDAAGRKVWSTASDLAVGTNVSGIVARKRG